MTHHMILGKDCFPLAYEGIKEFEIKPYINEYQNLEDNQAITVEDELTGSFYTAVITRVNYFVSLDDAFEIYDYKKILPYALSKEHGKEMLRAIGNFKINEMNHGVVIFKMTRISELIE